VGVVVWVACAYESIRLALNDQAWFWIGRSHLSIVSNYGESGTVLQKIADQAATLRNVEHVTSCLQYRMVLEKVQRAAGPSTSAGDAPPDSGRPESELPATGPWEDLDWNADVQAVGIRPEREEVFRQYEPNRVAGRMLKPDDTDAAVVDSTLAAQVGLGLGDRFTLRARRSETGEQPIEETAVFRVVGLLEHHRIAKQQHPVVLAPLDRIQRLAGYDREPRRVTKIDLILKDASPGKMAATQGELLRMAGRYGEGFVINSAANRIRQIQGAERLTQYVMQLLSTVALFTALFIILSTLSMGMVERIGQLGLLRCLGLTRRQMAALVLAEAIVLGIVGIILGIPVGLGLGKLTVYFAPEYVGVFAISWDGVVLAIIGGAVTTLVGALLPMIQTMRVSPLAASRPQSQPVPGVLAWILGILGVAMIVGHQWMLTSIPPNELYFHASLSLTAVGLLYLGYAFIVPAAIRIVGLVVVRGAARVTRLRHQLLADQVGKAVWRSSAICCGLMVGLSMIVTLLVHSESCVASWDFPKQFCQAFVYINPPVKLATANQARRVAGISESCLVNPGIRCNAVGKGLFRFSFSLFIAGDPDEFFRMANLEFVEGNQEDAIAQLRRGGCILVTPEFVRSKKLGYGDQVWVAPLLGSGRHLKIVGVVRSPALDIAANYFNVGNQLVSQSMLAVLGTFADSRKLFGVQDEASLFLINFDLPETKPPTEFAQDSPPALTDAGAFAAMLDRWGPAMPERSAELDRVRAETAAAGGGSLHWLQTSMLRVFRDSVLTAAGEWASRSPEERWQAYREEMVLELVARKSGAAWQHHGSIRGLKQRIDRDMRRATRLFATIPAVALIVAALGVGNLMMANVVSRSRQLATLRAVGATQWQVSRLIVGEVLVLGSLGCAVGIALGVHAAHSINTIVELIWGYHLTWTIPYYYIGTSIGFTFLVCLIAGLLPALRAARSNVIEALQTT